MKWEEFQDLLDKIEIQWERTYKERILKHISRQLGFAQRIFNPVFVCMLIVRAITNWNLESCLWYSCGIVYVIVTSIELQKYIRNEYEGSKDK